MARLLDRLQQRRHELFVGRQTERARFAALLDAAEGGVLFIHGPGGLGKTSLLFEYVRLCRERAIAAARLDGSKLEPSPSAFLAALSEEVGVPLRSPADLGALPVRVLIIDTVELLGPLDAWLRETCLPALPADTLVVLAGREPPSSGWRADAGWQRTLGRVALAELDTDESRDYLTRRGLRDADQSAVLSFARGHALALSLAADLCEHAPHDEVAQTLAAGTPDVVRALVEQLLRGVPEPAQRQALEATAVARTTTEPLLAAMLGRDEAHALFEWLRSLSFMHSDRVGLYPHELAQKALVADLGFRDPDRLRLLNQRALAYLLSRASSGATAGSAAVDCLYTIFQLLPPSARAFMRDRRMRGLFPEAATPRDVPALVALVARHEGSASAVLAEHWLGRQLQHAIVIRDGASDPAGLFFFLGLDELTEADAQLDPAVAAATRHPAFAALARAGHSAAMLRFWMARDTYQELSPVQALCASLINQHHVSWPRLGLSFMPFSRPATYEALATLGGYQREAALDFAVGGRRYGMFARDWRRIGPLAFLAQLVAHGQPPRDTAPPSRESFADGVRSALRQLPDPQRLATHPLLDSELVSVRAAMTDPPLDRSDALRALLVDAIDGLGGSRRSRKLHEALRATFLEPVGTQEETAEALDLPLSTYRRHLSEGIGEVIEILWQRAAGG